MSNGLAAIFAPIGHYKLLITIGQSEVGLAYHDQDRSGCQSLTFGDSLDFFKKSTVWMVWISQILQSYLRWLSPGKHYSSLWSLWEKGFIWLSGGPQLHDSSHILAAGVSHSVLLLEGHGPQGPEAREHTFRCWLWPSSEFIGHKLSTFYATPELFLHQTNDGPGVNVGSRGVFLYRMVMGSLPFVGEDF